jgi:hypothetical protein
MRPRFFLGLFLLLAPFAAPGTAAAQPPPGAVPLDRLLPQIRRAYPGQFLDAEGVDAAGSPHYHLKWLTPDGRVMWLDADARTGRIQRMAPGRDSFDAPRYRGGEESGGPQDRRDEGPAYNPRFGQDGPRFGNRPDAGQPYERPDGRGGSNFAAPQSGQPYMRRFEGEGGGPSAGAQRFENRGFGGFGNRGGGRDRNGR